MIRRERRERAAIGEEGHYDRRKGSERTTMREEKARVDKERRKRPCGDRGRKCMVIGGKEASTRRWEKRRRAAITREGRERAAIGEEGVR
ncbi:hypothetical protein AMTR_s00198p00018910 [Amborella trichopoda]|uniref:Uncharacterized protein n=1 Tax=Amborella trichopoda TaxID=13333 RepID=U5DD02_AMBTC|nr:hypothetical protein AMTR_s00198p00018910 [Amborella trichopoda]